ncbi:hypothetical protein CW304_21850 [Bacillus sp. UFRGS-B20]|nr:hypothetical protein CW304_21850 [Bacillus sp. UFRGS-B20]
MKRFELILIHNLCTKSCSSSNWNLPWIRHDFILKFHLVLSIFPFVFDVLPIQGCTLKPKFWANACQTYY